MEGSEGVGGVENGSRYFLIGNSGVELEKDENEEGC